MTVTNKATFVYIPKPQGIIDNQVFVVYFPIHIR